MSGSSPEQALSVRRKALAEAVAWVVKLHGPHRAPDLEAAFRDWLSADKENRRQFERATAVWDDSRGIPAGGLARVAYWNRSPGRSRWAMAAVILLTCFMGALGAYWVYFANVYRTRIGEQRIVRLEDGSRVSLNSDTQLEVKFSKELRRVRLAKGEAYFETTRDPDRPFIVSTSQHDVTALGTSFMVRCDSNITAVTLVDGKVTVSNAAVPPQNVVSGQAASSREPDKGSRTGTSLSLSPLNSAAGTRTPARRQVDRLDDDSAGSLRIVTLSPGQRLVLSERVAPRLDSPPIDTVTAWRRGEVVLDKTPLADAVVEMNRYEDRKLVVDSAEIGKLRISGIYRLGDSVGFAQTIAKLYRLQVAESNSQIRLTGNASPAPERDR